MRRPQNGMNWVDIRQMHPSQHALPSLVTIIERISSGASEVSILFGAMTGRT